MAKNDWLTSTDPDKLLGQLRRLKRKPSPRKLRLFACACCRQLGPFLEETCRQAIETAEKFADGLVPLAELRAVHDAAVRRNRRRFGKQGYLHGPGALAVHARQIAQFAWEAAEGASRPAQPIPSKTLLATYQCALISGDASLANTISATQAGLLREIAGNPYCPVSHDPAWLAWNDGAIPKLAQAIYDQRAFERLPILADALAEAGCTKTELLNHCREPRPHVRGCWVVDLLLEKH